MRRTVKVLIADDHSLLRKGLVQLLDMTDQIKVVGQALDGQEAVRLAEQLQPDVILMDINMPKLNGIEATRQICAKNKIPILALTIHDQEEYIAEMIRAGAQGYILKDSELSNLVQAIKRVAEGDSFYPASLMEKVMTKFHELVKQQHAGTYPAVIQDADVQSLTRRELEVLQCIVDGMSNKECAEHLYISEKTVKNHVTSLLRKLNVEDRTQAAVYAVQNGLVKVRA
ncbi:MAG: response regulator transcription factor [Limnochordia bacterium]|jgi:two-component system NarL family response regulator|nr:response regulator transcription factor [Bacillota bacterium]HOB09016.1 response regulator transcription factor [Limnochordia bacterium]HPT92978.1 response regulator transcription factor [Limnochordia bacterium]HPZ31174.1 response regulator transcription factor [Limnochordia bacterium]HQD69752.1 response regulator transcription factor [Limnochordia bacterium]